MNGTSSSVRPCPSAPADNCDGTGPPSHRGGTSSRRTRRNHATWAGSGCDCQGGSCRTGRWRLRKRERVDWRDLAAPGKLSVRIVARTAASGFGELRARIVVKIEPGLGNPDSAQLVFRGYFPFPLLPADMRSVEFCRLGTRARFAFKWAETRKAWRRYRTRPSALRHGARRRNSSRLLRASWARCSPNAGSPIPTCSCPHRKYRK
jgi:hypothetical protein